MKEVSLYEAREQRAEEKKVRWRRQERANEPRLPGVMSFAGCGKMIGRHVEGETTAGRRSRLINLDDDVEGAEPGCVTA